MKQLKDFIKKYLGETSLVGGVGLFIYNIFNFSYKTEFGLCRWGVSCEPIQGVVYYYQSDTILMISVGAMLIIIGILIIKNK